ncbi:MAG TPA: rod shape-determining protein MreD [Pyrinomonadaceae bacterium]|jgi:rod shape-determining protein MreD|nr:rod shape-determining protein MreD [Pyrinomonadaceae bacterium]
MRLKIAVCVALAVLLQTNLRLVWTPLVHLDLPLIVVTYFALRRDVVQALIVGFVAGLATDFFSKGLLGANGFSKTLIAYLIAALVTRVMLDNPLARIPVLAGAVALDAIIIVLLHRMLGQPSLVPFAETAAYKMIATTIAGTFIFYMFDIFFSDRGRQRRQFAFRRRAARRSLVSRR